jgi:hypothetical protein
MLDQQIWLSLLSAGILIIGVLIKIIHGRIQEDLRRHADKIETKADATKVVDTEHRMEREINAAKSENTRILDKLESRIDRDLQLVENRFLSRVDSLEANLAKQMERQLETIIAVLKKE